MKRWEPLLYCLFAAAIGAYSYAVFGPSKEVIKTEVVHELPIPYAANPSDETECTEALKAVLRERDRMKNERDTVIGMMNRDTERIESLEAALKAATTAIAQKPIATEPKPGELLLKLPDDAGNWFSTLFLQPDWETRPNEKAAVERLNQTDWGRDLQARTHFRVWKTDQAEAKPYFKFVPATPCLMIQKCNGEIVYREVNPGLAKDQGGLRRAINKAMKRHGNQPICVGPDCTPPKQETPPPANEVVVKSEAVTPADKRSALPAVLAFCGAGAVTYLLKFGHAVRHPA